MDMKAFDSYQASCTLRSYIPLHLAPLARTFLESFTGRGAAEVRSVFERWTWLWQDPSKFLEGMSAQQRPLLSWMVEQLVEGPGHTNSGALLKATLESGLSLQAHLIARNEMRLAWVSALHQRLATQPEVTPVLVLKGAAELLYAHQVQAQHPESWFAHYASMRTMDDVDLLCYPEHLEHLDADIQALGLKLSYWDSAVTDSAYMKAAMLSHTNHYHYRSASQLLAVDLHRAIPAQAFEATFPRNFTQQLWAHRQTISWEGHSVQVSTPEMLVVHMVCNLAHPYDVTQVLHQALYQQVEKNQPSSVWVKQFCLAYDHYLVYSGLKLGLLIKGMQAHYQLDWGLINQLLDTVQDRRLVDWIRVLAWWGLGVPLHPNQYPPLSKGSPLNDPIRSRSEHQLGVKTQQYLARQLTQELQLKLGYLLVMKLVGAPFRPERMDVPMALPIP